MGVEVAAVDRLGGDGDGMSEGREGHGGQEVGVKADAEEDEGEEGDADGIAYLAVVVNTVGEGIRLEDDGDTASASLGRDLVWLEEEVPDMEVEVGWGDGIPSLEREEGVDSVGEIY